MKYLLDTNICIHVIRKKPIGVLQRITSFAIDDIGVSSITVAELQVMSLSFLDESVYL